MTRSKDDKKLKIVIDFDNTADSQNVLQIMQFLRSQNCITYTIEAEE